jgi:hypothetical protein
VLLICYSGGGAREVRGLAEAARKKIANLLRRYLKKKSSMHFKLLNEKINMHFYIYIHIYIYIYISAQKYVKTHMNMAGLCC